MTAVADPTDGPTTGIAPEALFVFGALSQYLGAAIAVGLFDSLAAGTVAWLRVAGAAALLVVWRRPWRRVWTAETLLWVAAFGTALGLMNLSFYLAIDRLPLGTAVAIEFIGPIGVAAFGSRRGRSVAALVLATAGVVLLADVQLEGSASGVVFALCAGLAWAAYIVFGHRVAKSGVALDGLALGMVFGAAAIAIVGLPGLAPALDDPTLLVLALATGLLSNVVPYGVDQIVLARIDRSRFALLQALLPVTATAVGFVVLSQRPSAGELLGIALVVAAIVLRGR